MQEVKLNKTIITINILKNFFHYIFSPIYITNNSMLLLEIFYLLLIDCLMLNPLF